MEHLVTDPVRLAVSRRAVVRTLLAVAIALSAASALVQFAAYSLDRRSLLGFSRLLDMQKEANLPTWFSALLLLACAGLLAVIWMHARRRSERDAWAWLVLAVLLAVAATDEATEIHEAVGRLLGDSDRGFFIWMVPGTALLIGLAIALRGFAARLPDPTRRGLVWGAAVWVLGALGIEFVEFLGYGSDGWSPLGLALLNTLEDLVEIVGAVIVLDALMRYALDRRYRATVSISP